MNIPATDAPAADALAAVLRYHEQTKHHFFRYARGPGALEWANQPDPFRRYAGAPLAALPRLSPDDEPVSPSYEDLYRDGAIASAAISAATLSRWLECSFAITAWKQAGDVRWALRANPSSGNLHPTEAYLLIDRVAGLSPVPGLYHYAAREHALELRAEWPRERFQALMRGFPAQAFLLGLSSVHWREAWKYGERAFRYCQHDVGHALGAARLAARMLGWRMLLLDGSSDGTVATLLGLDRRGDFEGAEPEHPAALAVVWPADAAAAALPLFVDADALQALPPCAWHGLAGRSSRGDPVPWDIIETVRAASWKPGTERQRIVVQGEDAPAPTSDTPPAQAMAAHLMRQRRSALAFDRTTPMPADTFFDLLVRTLPRADREASRRPLPWDLLPWAPALHLALFVHRVDGLAPGLYLLLRDESKRGALRRSTWREFAWRRPAGCPDGLPLFLLQEADTRPLAAQLSCGQAIAADGAFSLAMIAEFAASLTRSGPWFYRRLYWECGVIGQLLYLEAEAIGLRATGIGCYFDDPVHEVLGLAGPAFQSLYHFTVGGAVEDPRLTTLPPYSMA